MIRILNPAFAYDIVYILHKSIKVTGAKLYNSLIQNIKDSKTLCLFKKRVKNIYWETDI